MDNRSLQYCSATIPKLFSCIFFIYISPETGHSQNPSLIIKDSRNCFFPPQHHASVAQGRLIYLHRVNRKTICTYSKHLEQNALNVWTNKGPSMSQYTFKGPKHIFLLKTLKLYSMVAYYKDINLGWQWRARVSCHCGPEVYTQVFLFSRETNMLKTEWEALVFCKKKKKGKVYENRG